MEKKHSCTKTHRVLTIAASICYFCATQAKAEEDESSRFCNGYRNDHLGPERDDELPLEKLSKTNRQRIVAIRRHAREQNRSMDLQSEERG